MNDTIPVVVTRSTADRLGALIRKCPRHRHSLISLTTLATGKRLFELRFFITRALGARGLGFRPKEALDVRGQSFRVRFPG